MPKRGGTLAVLLGGLKNIHAILANLWAVLLTFSALKQLILDKIDIRQFHLVCTFIKSDICF